MRLSSGFCERPSWGGGVRAVDEVASFDERKLSLLFTACAVYCSVYLSVCCLSIFPPFCLCVCLSVCLSLSLSLSLSL